MRVFIIELTYECAFLSEKNEKYRESYYVNKIINTKLKPFRTAVVKKNHTKQSLSYAFNRFNFF